LTNVEVWVSTVEVQEMECEVWLGPEKFDTGMGTSIFAYVDLGTTWS
jgi:hypothetical protein